jgi:hypothetical protein
MLFEQSEFIEWMKLWASHNLSKRRGGQTAWVYCFIIYQPTVTDWAFAVSAAGVNIKAKEGVPLTKGKKLSFSWAHIFFLVFPILRLLPARLMVWVKAFDGCYKHTKKSIQPHHKRQSLNLKNGVFKVFFLTPKFTGPISQLQIKKD